MKVPKITLEQWSSLVAVVEEGSFAKAAERLNKSQSAISYAIARLEEQLPMPALYQQGRRALLTELGEVLYRRAKQLLEHANDLEGVAKCFAEGWASELVLAVESIVPMDKVLQALVLFAEKAPQTRVVLLETTLSGTDEALYERQADMTLSAHIPTGFLSNQIGEVVMLPVASADHALVKHDGPLSEADLRGHRQIVVRDSGQKRNQDKGWLEAEQRLTVSHFSTAIQALEQGLGFCFVPESFIKLQLEQGVLKPLNLSLQAQRKVAVYLVLSSNDHVGPAVQALVDSLQGVFRAK